MRIIISGDLIDDKLAKTYAVSGKVIPSSSPNIDLHIGGDRLSAKESVFHGFIKDMVCSIMTHNNYSTHNNKWNF